MRTIVIVVVLFGLVASAEARKLGPREHALGATLAVIGGFASGAGTILGLVWNQQFWSQFGCEFGAALAGTNEDCGHLDRGLVPAGATLVAVGQASLITGIVLLRY